MSIFRPARNVKRLGTTRAKGWITRWINRGSGKTSWLLLPPKSEPTAFSMRFLRPFRPIHLPVLKLVGLNGSRYSAGQATALRFQAFVGASCPKRPTRPRGWSDVFHLHGDSNANPLANLPPAGHRGRAHTVLSVDGQCIRRHSVAPRSRYRPPGSGDQPAARAGNLHRQLEFGDHNSRPDHTGQRRSRRPHRGLFRTGLCRCRCKPRSHASPRHYEGAHRLHPQHRRAVADKI